MKYVIPNKKLTKLIGNYILENFSSVSEVYFENKKVILGATPDNPKVDKILINVIIDNSKNKLRNHDLVTISREIRESTDRLFGLDYQKYGSGWDFNVTQIANVPLYSRLEIGPRN